MQFKVGLLSLRDTVLEWFISYLTNSMELRPYWENPENLSKSEAVCNI
jgi:hypothetical protein